MFSRASAQSAGRRSARRQGRSVFIGQLKNSPRYAGQGVGKVTEITPAAARMAELTAGLPGLRASTHVQVDCGLLARGMHAMMQAESQAALADV